MTNGVIEYAAMITGYRALLVFVAALYALAWLFATRFRVLADAGLAVESGEGDVATRVERAPAPTL